VEVYGLPKDRIYATIFEGNEAEGVPRDMEAWELWKQYLPEDHIILGNKKDNFWEMGDTGPCGPCSEVHFDLRSDTERKRVDGRSMVNTSNPHVIEIWNLVFMQFNRKANGSLEALPASHVDTGMGFERLCMILEGKQSNYDTDVFQPSIKKIAELAGRSYGAEAGAENGTASACAAEADRPGRGARSPQPADPKSNIAMRVIADHLRAISFSIADGQLPSNVKAGYVIRRILRRAVRYGYTYLGFNEPFICKLVAVLAAQMGDQYPELRAQQTLIESVIREEESAFLRTLATGITLLEGVIEQARSDGKGRIGGDEAFLLYDTYGFPIDLTELIAHENGLEVDLPAFEKALAAQKERSRGDAAKQTGDWVELFPLTESEFVGYDTLRTQVRIARYRQITTKGKTFYQLVFDHTPFYATSGGQQGDTGYIAWGDGGGLGGRASRRAAQALAVPSPESAASGKIRITDTQKENNLTVHIAETLPPNPGARFEAVVDEARRTSCANNHTATHLMHEALRELLGTHVEQKGSMVTPDYLRFDFSHFQKVTDEQLREVEQRVNAAVRANLPLDENRDCPIEKAREMGAMMLFGEKYGSHVRVVRFGRSVELCGGTHTSRTGNIGVFRIVAEGAISAGVRRIEAVTGAAAEKLFYEGEDTLRELRALTGSTAVEQSVRKLIDENAALQGQIEAANREKTASLVADYSAALTTENGALWLVRRIDLPAEMVKDIAFALQKQHANIVFIAGSGAGDKATLAVMLGAEIVARGVNAAEIVRSAAREIEGGGGGQPFFATAGGKNPAGLERAMATAAQAIKEALKK